VGITAICEMICGCETLIGISKTLGVGVATLLDWIEKDPERSALARESRTLTARLWDEKAEQVITEAKDPFELNKARELAHHYRWRAKAIAPRDYGDRVTNEHTGKDGAPITVASVNLKGLSDDELTKMQQLLTKAVGEQ
jgi:hypothetical protein